MLTKQTRLFLFLSALFGASGVALGAYASHGLGRWASTQQVEYFQLAVNYQLLHAITLLVVSVLGLFITSRLLLISQIAFVVGIVCFSGSLYLYVFSATKMLALITPLGGLSLIIAWLLLAISIIKKS